MKLYIYIGNKLLIEKKNVITDSGLREIVKIILGSSTEYGFNLFRLAYSPTITLPGGDAKLVTSIPTDPNGSVIQDVSGPAASWEQGQTGKYIIHLTATVNTPAGGLSFNEAASYLGPNNILFSYTNWSSTITLPANSTVIFKWDFIFNIV